MKRLKVTDYAALTVFVFIIYAICSIFYIGSRSNKATAFSTETITRIRVKALITIPL